MDYSKIRVPFLGKKEIKNKADVFRTKFWDNSVPVDIENIIDLKLKIDLVPVLNLQNFCDTDALISSNWRSIYVDKDSFLDGRFQNRLRFSLAHEIGHFVLHKNIYGVFNIKSFTDFYKLIEQIPQEQYNYLESQANKFANYLLVPREILVVERDKALKENIKSIPLEGIDKNTLNSYLAIPVSRIFGVSDEVVQIALDELD